MKLDEAQHIVNEIFDELEGRGGFDILNMIRGDKEVYDEMYATCVERVQRASSITDNPQDNIWHPEFS